MSEPVERKNFARYRAPILCLIEQWTTNGSSCSIFPSAMTWPDSLLSKLESRCGVPFPSIRASYERSERTMGELSELVRNILPEEASFVTFGSLARKEFTTGSDLDWCLMIDGRTDPGHRDLQQTIKQILGDKFAAPNPAGAFGYMVFGHELVHLIGGFDDTNANLTRRQLLLLESAETEPHSQLSPRSRIIRSVLQRYFEEEANFPGKAFFPRFFLNDVVRYWRTIAVDYAAKNSERRGQGWALRNTKLRFSRKLLFVAGLLLTYETTLFPVSDLLPCGDDEQLPLRVDVEQQLSSIEHCFQALQLTPLESLARICINLEIQPTDAARLFQAYDRFLDILDCHEKRSELTSLTFETAKSSGLFQEVRDLSHDFQESLSHLLMNRETLIGQLTLRYGIF